MTFAEQLEQRGLQKGLHQGRLEAAKNMLAQGSDPEFIKLVTGLTDDDLDVLDPS